MTIAKPPKATPTTTALGKAVLDKPVVNFDKQLQDRQQVHLADLIDANTRGVLT